MLKELKKFVKDYKSLKEQYEEIRKESNRNEIKRMSTGDFDLDCDLVERQKYAMEELLHVLELRAALFDIDLDNEIKETN